MIATLMLLTCPTAFWANGPGSSEASSSVNSKSYDRDAIYLKIDGPDINAFNLNFVVQFPLAVGLSYPENAGVALQLNLTYNSRVTFTQRRGAGQIAKSYGRVRRQNPFGLGFDLSLGRIIRYPSSDGVNTPPGGRLLYVDSSGASHGLAFFQTTAAGDEWRTRDGSHIRATWADGYWKVNFPNGVVQELRHYIGNLAHHPTYPLRNDLHWGDTPADDTSRDLCETGNENAPDDCDANYFIPDPIGDKNGTDWIGFDRDFVGWHVTKVYTPAAISATPASYTVEYFGDDGDTTYASFAHIIRYIRDQHGRTIEFVVNTVDGTISDIRPPAPGNAAGSRPPAEYHLEYESARRRAADHADARYDIVFAGMGASARSRPPDRKRTRKGDAPAFPLLAFADGHP